MGPGQNQFYTLGSLTTFLGSVAAVGAIANVYQRIFQTRPEWVALIAAQLVCLGTVYFTHQNAASALPGSDYFVAVINAFLVAMSAGGATTTVEAAVRPHDPDQPGEGPQGRRGFFTPWWS